ncbi:MAG: caspase family protein [Deltaproteobacteria bacterium]|nr:MAG: caspase family protein [Deltaproteobacteria bacterium]
MRHPLLESLVVGASTALAWCLLCGMLSWVGGFASCEAEASPATWQEERVALVVGHNDGGEGLPRLRYAQTDATKVAKLLREVGGYKARNVVVLQSPKLQEVRLAMRQIRRRLQGARRRGMFVFYFSGHAKEEAMLLGKETLPFKVVYRFAKALPVRVRLLFIDSCYSGRFLRVKGMRRVPSIRWAPGAQIRTEGMAILTSSEANGRSYESDRIRGSLFTSSLLAGLRGAADKNNDRLVSLSELHQYVYHQTLARSLTSRADIQRPSHRFQLRGQGPLFLANLQMAPARLILGAAVEGHVFVYQNNSLVQDFYKSKSRNVQLALRSGSYRLMVRHQGKLATASFTLTRWRPYRLSLAKLRWSALRSPGEEKGLVRQSPPPPRSLALGVLGLYETPAQVGSHRLGVGLQLDLLPWLQVGAGFTSGLLSEQSIETHQVSLSLGLGYGWSWRQLRWWVGGRLEPFLWLRVSANDSFWNLGLAILGQTHLDWFFSKRLALRFLVAGGARTLAFTEGQWQVRGTFSAGVGVMWKL